MTTPTVREIARSALEGLRVQEIGHPLTTGTIVGESPAHDGFLFVHWDGTPKGSVHSVHESRLIKEGS